MIHCSYDGDVVGEFEKTTASHIVSNTKVSVLSKIHIIQYMQILVCDCIPFYVKLKFHTEHFTIIFKFLSLHLT